MDTPYFNNSMTSYKINSFDFREDKTAIDFPIAFGTDQNFLLGCGIAITSILIKNPNANISFHIFTNKISTEDQNKFLALSQQYKIFIVVYTIKPDLNKLPITKNWTSAIYYRFIIFDYFVGKYEKVLYLDSDIVCENRVTDLINMRMGNNIAAVVPDASEEWWLKKSKELRCDEIKFGYFNSGVLLVNLQQWAVEDISRKAINMLTDKKIVSYISYPDQDVLNILLAGKILFLDKKYNSQLNLNHELKKNTPPLSVPEAVFIHYIGPTKPWHAWCSYTSTRPFLQAKKISPWQYDELLNAKNATQSRYAAKHYRHQGKYIVAYEHWFKYYFFKLKNCSL